jgi:hypothetical protein
MKKAIILFLVAFTLFACSNNVQDTKWTPPEGCDTAGFHAYCDSVAIAWHRDSLDNEDLAVLLNDWCKDHHR